MILDRLSRVYIAPRPMPGHRRTIDYRPACERRPSIQKEQGK